MDRPRQHRINLGRVSPHSDNVHVEGDLVLGPFDDLPLAISHAKHLEDSEEVDHELHKNDGSKLASKARVKWRLEASGEQTVKARTGLL